jgi:RNA polymerase sigma factor (sigma-70 family)
MADSRAESVLRHLHHWLDAEAKPADDGWLLERFIGQRDEAAFAELVSRHGPLVMGLCRRLLGNLQDAEDVFQATFFVLARKAATIRKPGSLSCWLHGVASRLALKTRAEVQRRRIHERQAVSVLESAEVDLSWREVRGLIDEELQRLPQKQRLPLVLCYLEGLTQDEASRRLGWPRGTLKRRLEAGRERLRLRLTRRGVTLGAGLFAVALSESAIKGAVSLTLRNATAWAAVQFVTQKTAALAATPAALLAEGALQTMLTTKLKLGAMAIVLFGCVVTAAGLALPQATLEKQPESKSEEPPKRTVEEKRDRKDRYGDPLPAGAIARLGTVHFRQPRMRSVVFTRDGKTAIAGDLNGYIVYWDVATGRQILSLPRMARSIDALAISHDGKTLACTDDGEIYLREVASGKLLSHASLEGSQGPLQQMLGLLNDNRSNIHIQQMLFTPDGKTLALRPWQKTIYLWDIAGNKTLHELKGHKDYLSCMALSPDGKTLASASKEEPHIRLWDIAAGKEKLHFAADDKGVESLAFSPDGKTLVSIGSQPSFAFFDANTGKKLRTVKDYSGGLSEITYTPDGKILLGIHTSGVVHALDAVNGKRLRKFDAPRRSMGGLTLSPDGKTAATVLRSGGPTTFDLWDVAGGKPLHSFAGHRGGVSGLAFSADGARLFSSTQFDDSNRLLIWDATTGEPRGQLANIPTIGWGGLALSPDGKLLAAGGRGSLRLLDPVSRKVVRSCIDCRENEDITSLVWSADGKILFSSTSRANVTEIHVWDPTTGKRRRAIETKWNMVFRIALSPDGALVAANRLSNTVHLWSMASGKELRPLTIEPKAIGPKVFQIPGAFSPDGTILACGGESISLWEPATGRLLRRWEGRADSLAFSSDGRTLISTYSTYSDRYPCPVTTRLWETATGKERASFTGQAGQILTLAISRDGRRIASGSDDTTIVVWDATGGARPDAALSAEQLQTLWRELIDDDAGRAYRALWQLALSPKQALSFLAERLQPAAPLDRARRKQVDRLLADLDSEQFAVRQQAETELEKMGRAIEPALCEALQNKPSPEARRRIEKVLERLAEKVPEGPASERLRIVRALEAIEHMNALEAQHFLDKLAKGAPHAWLTEEARAIRKRLTERGAATPQR